MLHSVPNPRRYFMHERKLLGDLARLPHQTIQELMSEVAGEPRARPSVVAAGKHLADQPIHVRTSADEVTDVETPPPTAEVRFLLRLLLPAPPEPRCRPAWPERRRQMARSGFNSMYFASAPLQFPSAPP